MFGSYLARIGREETEKCWFCGAAEDDVEHTIAECPTWDEHRQRPVGVIGPDLSIRGLVDALLKGPWEWSAISQFSEAVLRAKEDREREHEKFGVRRRMLRASRVRVRGKRKEDLMSRVRKNRRRKKEQCLTFVIGQGRENFVVKRRRKTRKTTSMACLIGVARR